MGPAARGWHIHPAERAERVWGLVHIAGGDVGATGAAIPVWRAVDGWARGGSVVQGCRCQSVVAEG